MCGLICILGMAKLSSPKSRLIRIIGWLQLLFGGLVLIVNIYTLASLHTAGFFFYDNDNLCGHHHGALKGMSDGFNPKEMTQHIKEALQKMETLQLKLEDDVRKMSNDIPKLEFKKYLEEEVVQSLFGARIALREVRLPRVEGTMKVNEFKNEEIRKYITPKENRKGKINTYKMARIHNTIGHACVLVKKELEEYMNYEVGSYCKDDWNLAQDLMLHGCDPLPCKRCLTGASKLYLKPYPVNESLWKVPDARNVRWSHYSKCKDFECLSRSVESFHMEKEKLKWVNPNTKTPTDFLIKDVLAIKPREIRIGLDYSIGTGTFAARMMEHNVTVISTALNLGAPYNEMIALRGLVPLYVTPNQRLPLFENTLDLIHTTGLLDGGLDMLLLDFIMFDFDRVLRPGGLLWIDKFLCRREDLEDYMYMFLQFRYKKHRWVVSSKNKEEVYLSALLEKPPRTV